jgi:hypothetical protein
MIVKQASDNDISDVVHNMREADRREVMAGRFVDDPETLSVEMQAARPFCFALFALCADDGWPIAIIGARLRWPGVGSILMIATDEWPRIARPATRWVKRVAIPKILDPLCHRTQCEAWEGNLVTLRWLTALGYKVEGRLEAYGKNREGFLQYARIRPEPNA